MAILYSRRWLRWVAILAWGANFAILLGLTLIPFYLIARNQVPGGGIPRLIVERQMQAEVYAIADPSGVTRSENLSVQGLHRRIYGELAAHLPQGCIIGFAGEGTPYYLFGGGHLNHVIHLYDSRINEFIQPGKRTVDYVVLADPPKDQTWQAHILNSYPRAERIFQVKRELDQQVILEAYATRAEKD